MVDHTLCPIGLRIRPPQKSSQDMKRYVIAFVIPFYVREKSISLSFFSLHKNSGDLIRRKTRQKERLGIWNKATKVVGETSSGQRKDVMSDETKAQ